MGETLSEDQMRVQMHRTMQALERMANAVTDYLTADKQPAEENASPAPDYSSLITICKECSGRVVFEDYERQFHSPKDTCTCGSSLVDNLDVPLQVKAIYEAIHKARMTPPIVACPGCKKPSVVNSPTKLCATCLSRAQRNNWKKAGDDADFLFEGNVVVKGDLLVEGCTKTAESSNEAAPSLIPQELDHIRDLVVKHHKALALITTFGLFKEPHPLGAEPARTVRSLLGMKACDECGGTGWLARDETCKTCKRTGYIKG